MGSSSPSRVYNSSVVRGNPSVAVADARGKLLTLKRHLTQRGACAGIIALRALGLLWELWGPSTLSLYCDWCGYCRVRPPLCDALTNGAER